MELKFYLNKFLKVDNIEEYSLTQLLALKDAYSKFIEKSEGFDPDFPMTSFGAKGKKIGGTNVHTIGQEGNIFEGQEENKTEEPRYEDIRKIKSVNERALDFLKNVGEQTNT